MPLSTAQLLIIRQAIADKIALAGLVCFPTAIYFAGANDFWQQVAPKVTQKDIETTPIAAVWIRYLRFEDAGDNPNIPNAGEADSPVTTRFYELTVFRSQSRQRLDETITPDAFKKRLLKTEIEIETDIENLTGEFRGVQILTGLAEDDSAVRETNSLVQNEFIESETECEFIKNVTGSQVKLICAVKIQMREC